MKLIRIRDQKHREARGNRPGTPENSQETFSETGKMAVFIKRSAGKDESNGGSPLTGPSLRRGEIMTRIITRLSILILLVCGVYSEAFASSICPYFKLKLTQISSSQVQVTWTWAGGLEPDRMTLVIQRTPYMIQNSADVVTIENAPLTGTYIDTPPEPDLVYHYNTEVEVDNLYCQSKRYAVAFGNIIYRPGRGNAALYPGQNYCPAALVKQAARTINGGRSRTGRLKVHKKLQWGAQAHAAEMAHLETPSYRGLIERIQEIGYTPHGIGEAIAVGTFTGKGVVRHWLRDPTIRNYIRGSASMTMGTACVQDAEGIQWWALGIGQR